MPNNNVRFDLSDWLIHFFRDIDTENEIINIPEEMAPGDINDSNIYSAFFMLRSSIRQQKLWAGWAYRGNRRTIYGYYPAICFTDMPIAAFLEAGQNRRAAGQCMSPLALLFPKKDMFDLGARPVIYGLSKIVEKTDNIGNRIIANDIINYDDQYRYVTFDISSNGTYIDWTHEREWRLPFRDDETIEEYLYQLNEYGTVRSYKDVPGINLSNSHISNVGIIVENQQQLNYIVHDLTVLIDRNIIPDNKFSFIISLDKIKRNLGLVRPKEVNTLINQSLIHPLKDLEISNDDVKLYNNKFSKIINDFNQNYRTDKEFCQEYGSSWLWIQEPRHKLTRALLRKNNIIINTDGRYLVSFSDAYRTYNLQYEEYKIKELAKVISKEFNIKCDYFTVAGTCNPEANELPTYCNPPFENKFIYNYNN